MLYYQKPTLQSLASILAQLRNRLTDLSIISKLGCCSDGFDWYEERNLLRATFAEGNMQLKVTVCDPEIVRFNFY